MSFTTPDFADAVQSALTERGYNVVEPTEEDDAWRWTWGEPEGFYVSGPYASEHSAWAGAFEDFVNSRDRMVEAAAKVIGRWERGNLAAAVQDLQVALEGNVPGDTDTFVKEHS